MLRKTCTRRLAPIAGNGYNDFGQIAQATPKSFSERVAALQADWDTNPRWANVTRPYTAEQVVKLQGSTEPLPTYSKRQSEKIFNRLSEYTKAAGNGPANSEACVTFGALDPVQIVQMAKYARGIYVSGWQCAATSTTTNETGPDLADYPYNTVPDKVDELVRALQFHDKKQWAANNGADGPVDYSPPIIADADTGHGGLTAVGKLTKLFIQAGAAGGHYEDQSSANKKCGHMGGKVLVPMQVHIDRLCAARLQSDIMGASFMLVARTDAEAGSLIDSDIDPRDHPFIRGIDKDGKEITYGEAVRRVLSDNKDEAALKEWAAKYPTLSNDQSLELGKQLTKGANIVCDKQAARTRDGFFSYQAGVEAAIARSQAFAPYGDIAWMETGTPTVKLAGKWANAMKGRGSFLAYNLSPSFNWDAAGMSDAEISNFCKELANLGIVFQFITLAGFHGSGLIADTVASGLMRQKDMLHYVKTIQRVERENKVELLTHQKWAGASYVDQLQSTIRGIDSSKDIGINSAGSTETQFK